MNSRRIRNPSLAIATVLACAAGAFFVLAEDLGAGRALAEPQADEPDAGAPPGAPPSWLPPDDWVQEHWLPFDHRDLLAELGVDYADVRSSLGGVEETSLADLAREAGTSPRRLAARLVADWPGRLSDRRRRLLGKRARMTLTHSHLSKHMFGHPFHTRSRSLRTEQLFRAPAAEVRRLYREGHSYYEIGEMYGRSREELLQAMTRLYRTNLRRGVRAGETPRAWARFFHGLQRAQLPEYLAHSIAGHEHAAGCC